MIAGWSYGHLTGQPITERTDAMKNNGCQWCKGAMVSKCDCVNEGCGRNICPMKLDDDETMWVG